MVNEEKKGLKFYIDMYYKKVVPVLFPVMAVLVSTGIMVFVSKHV